jgi:hypothetical protein
LKSIQKPIILVKYYISKSIVFNNIWEEKNMYNPKYKCKIKFFSKMVESLKECIDCINNADEFVVEVGNLINQNKTKVEFISEHIYTLNESIEDTELSNSDFNDCNYKNDKLDEEDTLLLNYETPMKFIPRKNIENKKWNRLEAKKKYIKSGKNIEDWDENIEKIKFSKFSNYIIILNKKLLYYNLKNREIYNLKHWFEKFKKKSNKHLNINNYFNKSYVKKSKSSQNINR